MSNYSVLKQDINNNIYENQTQQITGTVLNAILNEMTASLGAGYQFAGVATLGMNPGDPDQRVFYLAGEGIYTSFGGIQVPAGKLGVLKWDNRWTLQTIDGLGGGGANLTGYISVASTDDLPDVGQPTLGYLCGTNLYLYVGTGGDTKEGKYQNCGSFRGPQGLQGDPGVGIATVTQTTTSTEDEGINVITVTKEDGTQSTFQVRNGSKGSQGIQGPQGVQGEPGRLQAQYKEVETLPTASADTVDYIYLVASQTPNTYDMYYTEENQGAYSWKSLGTTAVQLSDYATKAEVNQLEAEVHQLAGKYYGLFETSADLPEGDATGYAFVGASEPFSIWNFDGEEWADSGATVEGITGEPGVGFESVASPDPADGTVIITLSNGDTMTLDLNHTHSQYTKVQICQDKAEYDAITTKDSMTFYLIPEVALYFGDTLILENGGGNLPYTPVLWIETDGTAYINTGIKGNTPMSAYCKMLPVAPSSGTSYFFGHRSSTNGRFVFLLVGSDKYAGFTYGSNAWASSTNIATSVDNQTPIEAKTSFANGSQSLSIKKQGDSSYTVVSKTASGSVSDGVDIYIFCYNNQGAASTPESGTKCYGVKIYSDANFGTLVFDGVPCYYSGEYGLWDKVSDTFFGNAAGSGAFTGPQI